MSKVGIIQHTIEIGVPKPIDVYIQDDEGRYFLGSVVPPTRAEGNRINALWCEWREAVPEPDADAEFIVWLIEAKGWTEAEANNEHTVEI
jgi:hypothetical protein